MKIIYVAAHALLLLSLAVSGAGITSSLAKDDGAPEAWPSTVWCEPAAGDRTAIDDQGDALPQGAMARIGTRRFRHGQRLSAMVYAPDGKTVATASQDRDIRIWDLSSGKVLKQWNATAREIVRLEYAAGGRTLLSESKDRELRLWDVASGRLLFNNSMNDATRYVLGADGNQLIVWWQGQYGGNKKSIEIIDTQSGQQSQLIETADLVYSLDLGLDNRTLAAGVGKSVILFDITNGKLIKEFQGHSANVTALAISRDGQKLASGGGWTWSGEESEVIKKWREAAAGKPIGQGASIILWDIAKQARDGQLVGPMSAITALAFSPDGKILASGSGEGDSSGMGTTSGDTSVRVWDLQTKRETYALNGHKNVITGFLFGLGGARLISKSLGYSTDDSVIVWDLTDGTRRRDISLSYHRGDACDFRLSPDGTKLALGGRNKPSVLYDLAANSEKVRLDGIQSEGWTEAIAFSPDNQTLALGEGYSVRFWDCQTGKNKDPFPGPVYRSRVLGFTPAGDLLIGTSRRVLTTDLSNGFHTRELKEAENALCSSLSLDGRWLACGFEDKSIRVLDTASHESTPRFELPEVPRYVAISRDGLLVVASGSSQDAAVYVWARNEADQPRRLDKILHQTPGLGLSDDGKLIVTAAGVFDVKTGEQKVLDESMSIATVAFSPDSKHIVLAETQWSHNDLRVLGRKDNSVIWKRHDTLYGWQAVAFSTDGRYLASAERGAETAVRVFDMANGAELCRFRGFSTSGDGFDAGASSVCFSPDNKRLASAMDDTTVLIWNLEEALKKSKPAPIAPDPVIVAKAQAYSLAGVGGSNTIAAGGQNGSIAIWDLEKGVSHLINIGGTDNVFHLCSFPAADALYASVASSWVKLRISDGKEILRIAAHEYLKAMVLAPDGKTIVTSGDGDIACWSTETGVLVWKSKIAVNSFDSVAITQDGKQIACGGDGCVILLDATNGHLTQKLLGYDRWVKDLAFTPDGKQLVSADWRKIIVWDLADLSNSRTLYSVFDIVHLALIDGDEVLVCCGKNGTIQLLKLRTGKLLNTIYLGQQGGRYWIDPKGVAVVATEAGIVEVNLGAALSASDQRP